MMSEITIQEVSKHIPDHKDSWIVSNMMIFLFLLIVCIVIMYAIVASAKVKESSKFKLGIGVVSGIGVMASLILFAIAFVFTFIEHGDKLGNKAEWENKYMIPYIESLPTEKSQSINQLKLESDSIETLTFTHGNEPIFVDMKPKKLSLFEDESESVTLISKEIKLLTDLKQGEEPYVSYKYLDEPLGWYQSGAYNITLHLPVDYQFK